jgi:hypothetical protein
VNHLLRRLSLYFSAGALGGFINGLCAWFLGSAGITSAAGVNIAPALTPGMLYHRIVWGGIWGLAFFLPLAVKSAVARGILYSLGPTFAQLFIVFPEKAGKGIMGLDLGTLTPLFVLIFNAIWGLTAVIWLRAIGES